LPCGKFDQKVAETWELNGDLVLLEEVLDCAVGMHSY